MQILKDILFIIVLIAGIIVSIFYCTITLYDFQVNQKIMTDVKNAIDKKDKCHNE